MQSQSRSNPKGDTGNCTIVQTEERVLRRFKTECFDIVQADIKRTERPNTVGHDDTRCCLMIGNAAQGTGRGADCRFAPLPLNRSRQSR